MPRLEGKRTNPGLYLIVVVALLLLALVTLEYTGVLNLIPNFGAA